MAEDITPPDDLVAGESFTFEFTVQEDGSAKDISGATLSWYLLPDQGSPTSDAVVSDADTDAEATFTTDGTDGRVDVIVSQGATDGLGNASYWQRFEVDDTGDGLQIWRGPVFIESP